MDAIGRNRVAAERKAEKQAEKKSVREKWQVIYRVRFASLVASINRFIAADGLGMVFFSLALHIFLRFVKSHCGRWRMICPLVCVCVFLGAI